MTLTTGQGISMRRLLVVDDEPDVLDFVERVFRREYHVARAQSVMEAEAQLDAGGFDVIITDGRMPQGSGARSWCASATRHWC